LYPKVIVFGSSVDKTEVPSLNLSDADATTNQAAV
jgi:hypothetical protein